MKSEVIMDEGEAEWVELEKGLRGKFEIVSEGVAFGGRSYELLRPRSVDDLISEEDFNRDGRLPYWADVWPSALGLAQRVWQEPGNGRRMLELGCAVGFVACVGAAAGYDLTATDYYQEALDFTRLNARRNGLPIPAARLVDWREYPADLRDFDVVIASDVLYEKPYCGLVAEAFAVSLAKNGVGWLTDPQRMLAEGFPKSCEEKGLVVSKKVGIAVEKGGRKQTIDLYELQKRK